MRAHCRAASELGSRGTNQLSTHKQGCGRCPSCLSGFPSRQESRQSSAHPPGRSGLSEMQKEVVSFKKETLFRRQREKSATSVVINRLGGGGDKPGGGGRSRIVPGAQATSSPSSSSSSSLAMKCSFRNSRRLAVARARGAAGRS